MASKRTAVGLLIVTALVTGFLLRPVLLPGPVHAESVDLGHLQFQVEKTNAGVVLYFFDTKTGDVWTYAEDGHSVRRYHLGTLGQDMTNQAAQAR